MCSDLHRNPISAAHSSRLPSHLLRLVLERLVQFPAHKVAKLPKLASSGFNSIYLPLMSRARARYKAQCDGDYIARVFRGCESGQG